MPRAFAIAGIVGVISSVCLLEIPWLGVSLLVLMAVVPPRPATAAGALMGAGLASALVLWLAGNRCSADPSCGAPGLTGWIVAAIGMAATGFGLALLAYRRSQQSPQSSR